MNPMENQDGFGRDPMQLVKSKNRAIQKYLETLSGYSILVQFEARSTKRIVVFIKQDQTQLFSTTHCLQSSHWKAICMKTKDQLYQRESVILRPRVVLKASSQSHKIYLYKKQDHLGNRNKIRRATADYRIPGISISTVKLQDARRQNNVTKLIEMFEKTSA